MPYRRGDVVLVRFPLADLVTYKKRPALVVQDESVPTGFPQRVVAKITSVPRTGPSRVPVAKHSLAGKAMGLLTDSVVVTDHLATIEDREIARTLGRCPQMTSIDTALATTLGL